MQNYEQAESIAKLMNSFKWLFKFSHWTTRKWDKATNQYEHTPHIGQWTVIEMRTGQEREWYTPNDFKPERLNYYIEAVFCYHRAKYTLEVMRRHDGTYILTNKYHSMAFAKSTDLDSIVKQINDRFFADKPNIDAEVANKAVTRDIYKEYIKTILPEGFDIKKCGYTSFKVMLPNTTNAINVSINLNKSDNTEDWTLITRGFSREIALDAVMMAQFADIYKRATLKEAMASV